MPLMNCTRCGQEHDSLLLRCPPIVSAPQRLVEVTPQGLAPVKPEAIPTKTRYVPRRVDLLTLSREQLIARVRSLEAVVYDEHRRRKNRAQKMQQKLRKKQIRLSRNAAPTPDTPRGD